MLGDWAIPGILAYIYSSREDMEMGESTGPNISQAVLGYYCNYYYW